MSNVYSTRFICTHAGGYGAFTAPAGTVCVVRCITAFNPNAVLPETAGLVHLPSAATIWQVGNLGGASLDVGNSVVQELRVVLNAGETIHTNNGADVDMTVSGYVLMLP